MQRAVIKSRLILEDCLDLLDISWFPLIRETYDSFVTAYRKTNIPLPRQNPQRSKAIASILIQLFLIALIFKFQFVT
ncbi:MAG: hypothetical protein WBM44_25000 [Waterburya sp.]